MPGMRPTTIAVNKNVLPESQVDAAGGDDFGNPVTVSSLQSDPFMTRVAAFLLVLYLGFGFSYFSSPAGGEGMTVLYSEPLDLNASATSSNSTVPLEERLGAKFMTLTDAVYFSICTVTTVGYGDYSPKSDDAKILTVIFVFVGVAFIGTALGIVMGVLLDRHAERENAKHRERLQKMADNNLDDDIVTFVMRVKRFLTHCFGISLTLAIGTGGMMALEDLSLVDGFYFSAISVTTVGFGDITPKSAAAKWFVTLYLLFGCVYFGKTIGDIAGIPLRLRREWLERKVLAQYGGKISKKQYKELRANASDCNEGALADPVSVSRAEFALVMLLRLNRISESDLHKCFSTFDGLDKNSDRKINERDAK